MLNPHQLGKSDREKSEFECYQSSNFVNVTYLCVSDPGCSMHAIAVLLGQSEHCTLNNNQDVCL